MKPSQVRAGDRKDGELGAVAFFRKPIEPASLIDEVEAYMGNRGSAGTG